MLFYDTEGTLLTRYTDSAGNHEESRFVINERYCGLQPEGPIHGNLFRGDALRPSGYPRRLDKSCNRSGQPAPDFDVIARSSKRTKRGACCLDKRTLAASGGRSRLLKIRECQN